MAGKLDIEEIAIGAVMEATFWANPVEESGFRFRATHLDGRRAPKVVLSDDARIRPGAPCLVRIKNVRKAERSDRGAIEVEFVRASGQTQALVELATSDLRLVSDDDLLAVWHVDPSARGAA